MWIKKPFLEKARITSPFGERIHPITKKKRSFHTGIDLGLPTGTKIFAPMTGHFERRIDGKGINKGYGRYCILKCVTEQNTKVMFIFAHLSKWLVDEDKNVIQGEPIVLTGNSGSSTASHLHLELRIFDGKDYVPADPTKYINFA